MEGRSESRPHVHIGGTTLFGNTHVCGFFDSREEEYRVLLPFIKEGFDRGEKAFHVVSPIGREDHLKRLRSVGIDVRHAAETGQLELRDWEETYFPDGGFDVQRMIPTWDEMFKQGRRSGYAMTRVVVHMEWALEDRPGVANFLECEARFNLLPRGPDPVVCAYNVARFPANLVMDVLRAHPMVILKGVLMENPLFVPSEEFLRELRERDVAGSVRTRTR